MSLFNNLIFFREAEDINEKVTDNTALINLIDDCIMTYIHARTELQQAFTVKKSFNTDGAKPADISIPYLITILDNIVTSVMAINDKIDATTPKTIPTFITNNKEKLTMYINELQQLDTQVNTAQDLLSAYKEVLPKLNAMMQDIQAYFIEAIKSLNSLKNDLDLNKDLQKEEEIDIDKLGEKVNKVDLKTTTAILYTTLEAILGSIVKDFNAGQYNVWLAETQDSQGNSLYTLQKVAKDALLSHLNTLLSNFNLGRYDQKYINVAKEVWLNDVTNVLNSALNTTVSDIESVVLSGLAESTNKLFNSIAIDGTTNYLNAQKQTIQSLALSINDVLQNMKAGTGKLLNALQTKSFNELTAALDELKQDVLNPVTQLLTSIVGFTTSSAVRYYEENDGEEYTAVDITDKDNTESLLLKLNKLSRTIYSQVYTFTNLLNRKEYKALIEELNNTDVQGATATEKQSKKFDIFIQNPVVSALIEQIQKELPTLLSELSVYVADVLAAQETIAKETVLGTADFTQPIDENVLEYKPNIKSTRVIMKDFKRDATRFNLFAEYDLSDGTWEKQDNKIVRKQPISVESAIENNGAWSYKEGDNVYIDTGDTLLHVATIVERRANLKYGIVIEGSTVVHEVEEADIIDDVSGLF